MKCKIQCTGVCVRKPTNEKMLLERNNIGVETWRHTQLMENASLTWKDQARTQPTQSVVREVEGELNLSKGHMEKHTCSSEKGALVTTAAA
ncbi:hypothetical protein NDU88_005781 [Pleurodeles waltl]|uniref:Uncharacterized protein n=1 Tax=Pleurodeles waltl TaxID=8319 RepID=A0AAV7TDM4_PLEWA|nr:hypothetical protein NDU88_005781 [Pleurodeles waltl]